MHRAVNIDIHRQYIGNTLLCTCALPVLISTESPLLCTVVGTCLAQNVYSLRFDGAIFWWTSGVNTCNSKMVRHGTKPTKERHVLITFSTRQNESECPKTCLLPRNRSGTVGSQNRQKVLFWENDLLDEKVQNFPCKDLCGQWFTFSCQVSWKSVQLKWPKRCVIAYFCVILLRGLCSDSAVNFIGSLFPQPGRSDTMFRPNTSNFLEDNRESLVWTGDITVSAWSS